jgi:spermidine synthase
MSARFEELDYQLTPVGALSLRRRILPSSGAEVYEIKLGDEFLMSSQFTAGETALAELALGEIGVTGAEVAVGGLGLGYTALAALEYPGVRSVMVIEALAAVIEWHRSGLIPLGARLVSDPRCRLVHGDFFALLSAGGGLDPKAAERRFHAVLVDIDHSPRTLLHPGHGVLYAPSGLRRVAACLHPGGVFALWSNDPPDGGFLGALETAFATAQARVVAFHNPLQNREATCTIYLARTPG